MPQQSSTEELNRLSGRIIKAAIDVHKALGPGLLEHAYLACLVEELSRGGISVRRQTSLPLRYKGAVIDCAYRADLIVEGGIVVEVKAVEALAPIHTCQLYVSGDLRDVGWGCY